MEDKKDWEWTDFQEATLQIDFLEIDMVTKIQEFASQLDDENLGKLCEVFFESEDGLESIDLFEEIIEAYHDLLRD